MTQPIPEGFHTVTAHLTVDDGAAAIDFYRAAFGAEEISRMPGPGGQGIMHATLRIGTSMVMLNDEFPDWGVLGPKKVGGSSTTLHVYVEDVDAAFAKAVAAGAEVAMPVEDTFWGDRYGKVTDPFGHGWSIATHVNDPTPEEMQAAAAAAFGGGEE